MDRNPPDIISISTAIQENSVKVRFNVTNEQRETALKFRKMRKERINVEVAALGTDCYFSFWSFASIFSGRFIFLGQIALVSKTGKRIWQLLIKTMENR